VPRHNLHADVELDYSEEGLHWSLTCDGSMLARPETEA
jgi:hypothetical protein